MLFEALRNTCHICTLWILVFVSCVVFVFVSFSKTWPEHHQSYASLLLSQSSARCESFFVCFCILYLCAFVFCICVYLYFVFVSPEEYQVSIINPMPLSFYLSHLHAVNLHLNTAAVLLNKDHQYVARTSDILNISRFWRFQTLKQHCLERSSILNYVGNWHVSIYFPYFCVFWVKNSDICKVVS